MLNLDSFQMQIAKRAVDDLEAVEGTQYTHGTTADVLCK